MQMAFPRQLRAYALRMKRLFILLSLAVALAPFAAAQAPIFVVRHAEKAEGGDAKNPELSTAGQERAGRLGQMLRDAGIAAVYATEFKRTQQTAEPVARTLRLEVEVIAANDDAALVARLRAVRESALVVGHSNTLPEIIKALGIQAPVELTESDYDNLFVVLREPEPRLVRLHY